MRILTKLITFGSEVHELFQTFEHTAFRLEMRDRYNVPYEAEALSKFLAGDTEDEHEHIHQWHVNVRETTAKGRRWSRVRVVSEPLSDYTRYSLWWSPLNIAAGEDIRYLPMSRAEELDLPKQPHDYWLFDSRTLLVMHFDEDDQPAGHEIVEDPTTIVQHNYWRDVAKHYSIARDDFAAKNGELTSVKA